MIPDPPIEGKHDWQRVTLRGGPHDRQTFNVTADQDVLLLHDGPRPHRYFRVNAKPELHHEDRLGGAFGRARR